MGGMVHTRRSAETKEEHYDLLSGLLDAAQDDPDGSVAITEKELIGQCQLSCRIMQIFTRHPREYVHLSSCWT